MEERRLRECLLEVESRNDVFRFGNAIKAQWRLAQSCLEYQPNVCVALVGTASALEEAILCKESSDATDLGFLELMLPLDLLLRSDEAIINWSKAEIERAISDSNDDIKTTRLLSAASSFHVEHHMKMCKAMLHQWTPNLTKPAEDLNILLILQDDYIESTKSSRQPSKDSWLDCPGGKRDLGESSDDAAFREFLEETGIRIDLNDERFTQVFAGCPDNRVPKYYGQKTNKLYVIEAVESTCNEKSEEIQLQFSNVKL